MNIIGRLTRDAQIHKLKDDRQVVNFSVAVNHSYKTKQATETLQATVKAQKQWAHCTRDRG